MEGAPKLSPENARIKEILQQYRDVSNASISGPRRLINGDKKKCQAEGDHKQRPDVASTVMARKTIPSYAVKIPPKEQNGLKFKETLIDGVSLVCFSFGGEKRLCMNELVSKVLKDFSPQEISILRDRLQIHCPKCTPHQMESFKIAGVLPWPCSVASLISKSDAFRLLGSLTSSRVPRRTIRVFSADSLEVYHECFGGCVGTLEMELYHSPYSSCITCSQCDGVFSTRTFVTHNHSGERNTCHWGFDSSKWRFYLMLCNEHPTVRMQKLWEMLTNKSSSSTKRKFDPEKPKHSSVVVDGGGPTKKPRTTVAANSGETSLNSDKEKMVEISGTGPGIGSRRSAFRPWSPLPNRAKLDESRGEQGSSPRHPIPIPARIFAPHTLPYIAGDFSCAAPRSVSYSANFSPEIGSPDVIQTEDTPTKNRMGVISCTPSTKDPHSLEKTAREMVEVARNEKWETMPKQSSNQQSPPRNTIKFLEENIYRTLMNCVDWCSPPPPAVTLSSLIAQDLGDVLQKQDDRINEMSLENEKLQKELESLKEAHAHKMEEAYDELKSTQNNLRLLESRHREEEERLNNVIFKLKQEIEALEVERTCRNEQGSVLSLKQEVQEVSRRLKDKEGYCYELQNELRTLRAWIDSHCRQVTTKHDGFNNTDSVIRTLYLVNGNGTSKHHKNLRNENGISPRSVDSLEEEPPQLQVA